MKTYRNYLENRALRRRDPTIRQIKNGEPSSKWTDLPRVAEPFLSVKAEAATEPPAPTAGEALITE